MHKISIVSRGQMGGYTRYLPEEDRHLQTLTQFKAMIAAAIGGRVAEKLKFGEITTGASNDLEQATRIARQMVTRFGMSERLGPRSFGKRQEMIFLGREISEQRDYSLRTEALIDSEVDRILEEGQQESNSVLKAHLDDLDKLADYLLANETIDHVDLVRLLAGENMSNPAPPSSGVPPPTDEARASESEQGDPQPRFSGPEPQVT